MQAQFAVTNLADCFRELKLAPQQILIAHRPSPIVHRQSSIANRQSSIVHPPLLNTL
jgi:hypothetical protein